MMSAQQYLLLHKKKWPALFLLLLLPVWAFCRQPAASLPFSTLGIEHGLSNNTVRSIFQDHNGFMWFGTVDGLNRYDGSGFKVYRNKINDTNSLVNNIVYTITEDSAHNLWLGTRQGISRLDPILGRFAAVQLKTRGTGPYNELNTVIKDIKADRNNNIFIGSEGMGLLVCAKNTIQAEPVPLIGNNGSITQYTAKNIRVDNDNNVWVLVHKIGLALYDRKTKKLVLVNDAVANAAWIETEGHSIWITQGTILYNYNTANRLLTPALQGPADNDSNGVLLFFSIDAAHRFWIARMNGKMISWKPGEASAIVQGPGNNNYASYGGMYALFIDKQSRMWVGTGRGGLQIVDPLKGRFRTITHEPGNDNSLVDNIVYSMYEAPDGKLYIGTDGNGVQIWDRVTNTFTFLPHEPGNPATLSDIIIPRIMADHTGQIWIVTFRKGINRYDPVTKKIERFTLINSLSHYENNVVFTVCEDRQHRLWASALRQNSVYGGLYLYDRAANRFDLFDAALSDLFSLYEDKQGNLWGGNLNQLIQIDREHKQHKFYSIGHAVRSIAEDHNGNFWIGAEGGGLQLFDRTKGRVTARYTTNEGLCNDMVLNILPDSLNNLWISTFNGLSKFDIAKRKFNNYYQADGLQSNQFHFNSALALRTGELAFGGIKGISLFRPADIRSDHYMPRLLLTDLSINSVPIEKDNRFIKQAEDGHITSLTIPYDKAVFSFRYTALEYTAAEKISYAYYMEGWDRNWTHTGNIQTAAYTHLNEGHYIFRVRSTNAEGEWNPQEIAIRITVLPPWYRSWWAYTLYAIAVLGAIYLFYLYKIRQNRLHYEVKVAQLQAKEAQLTIQQEKEIHEKRLAFFTHVSHEFRTPLTLIIDPVKELLSRADAGAGEKNESQHNALNMVFRNARRLLSLVDQLLLFRKAESESDSLRVTELNVSALGRDVYDCFVHQARIKRIDYRFECAEDTIILYADREKLEIMLFNLLSNAIKFTPSGGKVIFQITTTTDNVTIQVTDSGPGIPPEVGDQLFNRFYQVKGGHTSSKTGFGIGLYLVKHFTTLHHGQVNYESKPGEGTTFRISLQTGTAHFAATEIYANGSTQPVFLEELAPVAESAPTEQNKDLDTLVTEKPTILIVDDDDDLRRYITQVFSHDFNIIEAVNGREGVALAQQYLPDLIISDMTMPELGGLELCRQVKDNPSLTHIPVILLTASTAQDNKLKGLESGADDYITKPFDKELLKARVVNLLKKRNSLQQYFYNEITLQKNDQKVSVEYREFLDKCIGIVEKHLDEETFSIKTLTMELGMSRSTLYRKVNSVSGQSIVGFIRFIRLRKAAELMINTEHNVTEIASMTGFNDIKYFRSHFNQLFGMNPSEYIKKFRKPFHNDLRINKNIRK